MHHILGTIRKNRSRKRDYFAVLCSLFVYFGIFGPLFGKDGKIIRYSGQVLKIDVNGSEPYIELTEDSSGRVKKLYCDSESLTGIKRYIGKEEGLRIDGKAVRNTEGENWRCVGRPSVHRKYQVGEATSGRANSKLVVGQVLEAEPTTGQIVYSERRGRRAYLTISKEKAAEMKERLDRMEVVEVNGNYRYDRVKRYFVEE